MADKKNKPSEEKSAAAATVNNEITDEVAAGPIAGKEIGIAPRDIKFNEVKTGGNIPCFVPGKNWEVNQTLVGRYIGTERIYSQKFTAGKKDAQGKKYRDQHILEDLTSGAPFGIWSVGVLGKLFKEVPAEAPVSLTYKGLGDVPFKEGDSLPHTFDVALGEGFRLQRVSSQKAAPAAGASA